MPKQQGVSLSVIKRLPRYYRFLGDLLKNNIDRISSRELAEIMRLTASQIRQDLNCFGGFGQQGYGYNVAALHAEIGNILGINNYEKTILIGAGNLGRALVKHMNFNKTGFQLVGVFDNDSSVIGQPLRGLMIQDMEHLDQFCREQHVTVAILCIPKQSAAGVAQRLIELGIKGFWNFSHYDLSTDFEGIAVENVHLGDSLMTLSFQINSLRHQDHGE